MVAQRQRAGGCVVVLAAMMAAWPARGADAPVVVSGPATKAAFTISKDTTAVTGPLREDGTVDYVGAWNRKYGAGVRAGENGWVLWAGEPSSVRRFCVARD